MIDVFSNNIDYEQFRSKDKLNHTKELIKNKEVRLSYLQRNLVFFEKNECYEICVLYRNEINKRLKEFIKKN